MADERGGFPSASGISRIVECRGSWLAERNIQESSVGDDWREEGSTLHDCTEQEKIPEHLSDEQKWALRTAINLKEHFYEGYELHGTIIKEKRLWAHRPNLTPLFSGKFDEAMIGDNFASICDYKFGRKAVPPASINIQMRAYAVLLWLHYPDKQIYAVSIIQPRVDEEERFSCASYTPEELSKAYDVFLRILDEAEQPNQPRTPCYHACEYCKAMPCPEAWEHFTKINL